MASTAETRVNPASSIDAHQAKDAEKAATAATAAPSDVSFEVLRPGVVEKSNIVDWDGPDDPSRPINWTASKKWTNLLLISTLTLLTPFASSMFAPSISEIMQEFGTTDRNIGSFVVSVYLLGYAFGPLFIAPCSELYGRLPVYQVTMVLFIIGNIACALSTSMGMLIAFRFITGCFGAGPLTIGPGSVADCFQQVERGRAMAVWTMPVLLGPCLGPAIGAYIGRALGWRWAFYILCIVTGAVLAICALVLQETHSATILRRRTEKLVRKQSKGSGSTNNTNTSTALRSAQASDKTHRELFAQSIIRPSKMLCLSPIILGLSLLTAVAYGTLYLLFTTVTEVFSTRYGIVRNVGLVYLGFGAGQFVGLFAFGLVSDAVLKRLAARDRQRHRTVNNGGVVVDSAIGEIKPEYRLPPMLPGGAMIPLGLLVYGWSAQYGVHWAVCLLGTFMIGFGMITVFTPVGTYLVDAFPEYAASATAANTVFRSLGGGLLPMAGPKMYAALDQGWGNTLLAGISLGLMGMIVLAIKYGEWLRTHPRYQLKL